MKTKVLVILFILLSLYSCSYSLGGVSLAPEVKTAYIGTFPNYSSLFNPNLSQSFSNSLIDIFDQRTKLLITNNIDDGDIQIEGEIRSYQVTPSNIVQGTNGVEVANQNKLTISVQVRYINTIEPEKNWDKSFSDNELFDANVTLESIESDLVETINDRLITQIFNDIATDW